MAWGLAEAPTVKVVSAEAVLTPPTKSAAAAKPAVKNPKRRDFFIRSSSNLFLLKFNN